MKKDSIAASLIRGRMAASAMALLAVVLMFLGYDFSAEMQGQAAELLATLLAGGAGAMALVSKIRESKKK